MVAHPAGFQRLLLGREFLLAPDGESFVALDPRQADEAVEHVGEEKAHPDAGSDFAPAKRVDAVVPVAGAQQRQAVGAHMLEGESDGEARMLVHGRALARDPRDHDPGVLVRRHGLGLEEGRDLVKHGSVAAFAHVASEHIGQPEVRIARLGPLAETGAAARRAMPPLEHVAFAELLGRVQHDLRPGEARFEQSERQHVLELVAITGGAAELVRTHAAEQPRRVKLVGQPGVDQPVEVRAVCTHLKLAKPLRPGGARRRKFILGARDADAAPRRQALRTGSAPGRRRSRSWSQPRAATRSRCRRPPRAVRRRARRRRSRRSPPSRG